MKRIAINENGIHMVFEVRRDKVRLMHFSALPLDENTLVRQGEKDLYFPSEIQVTGRNRPSNWHGAKIVETSPGSQAAPQRSAPLVETGNALEQIQLFRSGLDLHGRFRSGSRIDAGLFGEQYGQLVYQGVSSDGVSRGYGSRRIALLADRT